jgi:pimeloyl-ACP methyl ester carboxylesterase
MFVRANGIQHHLIEHAGEGVPLVVLHGYLDLARTFSRTLTQLATGGRRVLALDFRGHGETDRVHEGSYYHFADYLADLVAILDTLNLNQVHLVAHSMGGTVATMFAGTFPSRVATLTLIEGVGPPSMPADMAPDRTARWIETAARARTKPARVLTSIEEVVTRMGWSHPNVSAEILREMAAHSVRRSEGGYQFLFDPLHQSTSPGRFDAEAFEEYIRRIVCPVMMVLGHSPEEFAVFTDRAARYKTTRQVVFEGAGHMVHWTRPHELAHEITTFVSDLHSK